MSMTPPSPVDFLSALANVKSKHYLHIAFHAPVPQDGLAVSLKVQPVINTADDWLRYSFNCWIIWTADSPDEWYAKLKNLPELLNLSFLIIKVDMSATNRSGQFPKWIWDWVNSPRY